MTYWSAATTTHKSILGISRHFRRLNKEGLRCNQEKCIFVQPPVEYLGHTLSKDEAAKGFKINAILRMPLPTDVGTLHP